MEIFYIIFYNLFLHTLPPPLSILHRPCSSPTLFPYVITDCYRRFFIRTPKKQNTSPDRSQAQHDGRRQHTRLLLTTKIKKHVATNMRVHLSGIFSNWSDPPRRGQTNYCFVAIISYRRLRRWRGGQISPSTLSRGAHVIPSARIQYQSVPLAN